MDSADPVKKETPDASPTRSGGAGSGDNTAKSLPEPAASKPDGVTRLNRAVLGHNASDHFPAVGNMVDFGSGSQRVGDHFVDANKMIERGSNGQRRALEPTIAGNVAVILEVAQ